MKYILQFILLVCTGTAQAVVIAGGDGSGNTSTPSGAGNDPGFANIGTFLGASCVYLGNGWVLTAAHIDYNYGTGTPILPSSVQFGGSSYATASGSLHQLTNNGTAGMTALTDLVLFQLTSDPSLPSLSISSSSPTVGQSITMIGNGLNRASGTTYWNADWSQSSHSYGTYSGFQTTDSNTVRWGTNTVGQTGQNVNAGEGSVYAFNSSQFSSLGGANEAQAVTGDSGGGVFVKNGSSWQLAGIMNVIYTYNGQPSDTAVYGDETGMADLSFYSGQINTITGVPEPTAFVIAAAAMPFLAARRRR